eukprot:1260678-Rhodomonas_salina.1
MVLRTRCAMRGTHGAYGGTVGGRGAQLPRVLPALLYGPGPAPTALLYAATVLAVLSRLGCYGAQY